MQCHGDQLCVFLMNGETSHGGAHRLRSLRGVLTSQQVFTDATLLDSVQATHRTAYCGHSFLFPG